MFTDRGKLEFKPRRHESLEGSPCLSPAQNTEISGPASRAFDQIIRDPTLGPQ